MMVRSTRVAAAAFVCLVLGGCGAQSSSPESIESTEQPMSGGQVDSGDPAVGILFSHTGTHVNESCTGTLIAPNVVLTAGHCFDTNIMDAFYLGQGVAVQSGDTDWEKATVNMRRIAIDQWARQPNYKVNTGTPPTVLDVAVGHLAQAVTDVAPVGLASAPPPANVMARTVGFGRHPTSAGPDPNCLTGCNNDCTCMKNTCGCKSTQPIVGNVCLCNDMGAYDQLVKRTATITVAESLATTLHQTTVTDSVNLPGDSGGPLFYNNVIIGTDCCGHGPANAQTDQYWARVDLARDWIDGKLREYGNDGGVVGTGGGSGGSGGAGTGATGGASGSATGGGGSGGSATNGAGGAAGGSTMAGGSSGSTTTAGTGGAATGTGGGTTGSTSAGATTGTTGTTAGTGTTGTVATTSGVTAGTGGTTGAGGSIDTTGSAGSGKRGAPEEDTGACSCTILSRPEPIPPRAWIPALVGLALLRRRRRAG
jgi:hypothetical protein